MAKGQVTKTQTKKPALKTAKEKKQEKQAKKAAKDKQSSLIIPKHCRIETGLARIQQDLFLQA